MKRDLTLLIGVAIGLACTAQNAQLVLNSTGPALGQHPFVVFNPDPNLATNPGVYLVIENPTANGIHQLGTTNPPIIKSEAEQNKIRWATGVGTDTYTVPFSTQTGVAMPLSVDITTAGSGGTDPSIVFSTYNYLGHFPALPSDDHWKNSLYPPIGVTHMHDLASGLADNSDYVIDRFWIIDPGMTGHNYGINPAVSITFGYDPLEADINGNPGNILNLGNSTSQLLAQRFNGVLDKWGDVGQMGTWSATSVNNAVPPTTADFYRSWTLASHLSPLPIELLAWSGTCEGSLVKLTWTTASEQDNAYFTIEKSKDATTWNAIGQMPGAGNSSSQIQYAFTDPDASGLAYYRLRQTDIDGNSTVGPTIAAGCDADGGTRIVNAWDDGNALNVVVSSSVDGLYDLTLLDAQGKLLLERPSQAVNTGSTTLKLPTRSIASGIYMVRLQNASNSLSRRVHLN